MLRAFLGHRRKTGTDLNAFDRVDTHQRVGYIGVEAIEHRLPPTRRHPGGAHRHPGADGIAFLDQGLHVLLEFRDAGGISAEKSVAVDRRAVLEAELDGPELTQVTEDIHTIAGC